MVEAVTTGEEQHLFSLTVDSGGGVPSSVWSASDLRLEEAPMPLRVHKRGVTAATAWNHNGKGHPTSALARLC